MTLAAAGALWLKAALAAPFVSADELAIALVDGVIEISDSDGLTIAPALEERVRITVHDATDPEAERPSVLGRFELTGNKLRFVPMFPFQPGMSYRVRIGGAAPSDTVLTVPSRDLEPSTVVTRVYPTTDVLPENQLKLYVHFSAPMAGGDGLQHAQLLDEEGRVVVDPFLPLGEHFWDRDRRRYTIFFDPGRVKQGILPNEQMGRPLLEGKRYRLRIEPDWRDENGLPLKAGFEKVFVAGPADETPLDTATWRITRPQARSRDSLILSFPEPLDHEILGRAIEVQRGGTAVSGSVTIDDGETRWSFEPSAAWEPGDYEILASSDLEDLAGNRIGQPFEVDVFERIERPEEREVYRLSFTVSERDESGPTSR